VLSDNIGLNKAAIIERCIRRMREEYEADSSLSFKALAQGPSFLFQVSQYLS